jgi:glutathione S-transferase
MTARTLYYAPGACSLAVHIVLEEIGAPFETVRLDLARGDQRAPEFLSVNERGRVPALYEDGWVLTEVSAILRHLARAHRRSDSRWTRCSPPGRRMPAPWRRVRRSVPCWPAKG